MPERFGKWNSVYRFHLRWANKGVFAALLARHVEQHGNDGFKVIDATFVKVHQDACRFGQAPEERGLGKSKGGRNSKVNACVNRKGKALALLLRPGNEHESKAARELLGDLEDVVVLGDRGYDDDTLRTHIKAGGGVALIPGKANRKEEPFYIPQIGRERRVVENFFARIKRYRRVNTRYDRRAETFMAFVNLAALADWIRF
ncbi:IS5 family transposase IS427 [Haloferula sargassicola]|uniref:IS5 family transposase IS427 n=1 Tax=Haloferula sargassicola TaxID=490096 RepID=A0ABP9UK59_9BACT